MRIRILDIKTFILAAIFIAVFSVFSAEDAFYRIDVANNPAGFMKHSIERKDSQYVLNSRIFMKLNYKGQNAKSSMITKTILDIHHKPIDYHLELSLNDKSREMFCSFAADSVGVRIIQEGEPKTTSFFLNPDTYIIDSSVFDHFFIIAKILNLKKSSTEFAIYMPQVFQKGFLNVISGSELDYKGHDAQRLQFKFMGNSANAIIDKNTRKVLNFEIPSEEISLHATDELDTLQLKKAEYSEVYGEMTKFAKSNVTFEHPYLVEEMEANVSVPISFDKKNQNEPKIYVDTWNQKFKGDIENNTISGEFKIEAKRFKSKKAMDYPYTDFLDDLSQYFMATSSYPTGDTAISKTAIRIAGENGNSWEAAKSIVDYVADSIEYVIEENGTRRGFIKKEGNALTQAQIAVTMLRSLGIPARLVGGIIYTSKHFSTHHWAEVLVDKKTWLPIDPSTGEAEFFSAVHITLWEGLAKVDGSLGKFDVEVLDYEIKQIKE
ncbi:MAG: transglutaminase-like domain-containing protein [Candidatus Zixiibacteriota bacterium]